MDGLSGVIEQSFAHWKNSQALWHASFRVTAGSPRCFHTPVISLMPLIESLLYSIILKVCSAYFWLDWQCQRIVKKEKMKKKRWLLQKTGPNRTMSESYRGMSEFINGISYVFYHNSYLKYYLFLIILIRIQRNSIDISLSSFASN